MKATENPKILSFIRTILMLPQISLKISPELPANTALRTAQSGSAIQLVMATEMGRGVSGSAGLTKGIGVKEKHQIAFGRTVEFANSICTTNLKTY